MVKRYFNHHRPSVKKLEQNTSMKQTKMHHAHVFGDGLPEYTLGKKGNGSSCQEQAFDINADGAKERKSSLFSYFLRKMLKTL